MANNTVVSEKPVMANVVTKAPAKEEKKGLANGGVLGYAVGDSNNSLFRTFINAKATVSKSTAAKVFSSILEDAMNAETDPKVKKIIDLQRQLNEVLDS